MQKVAGTSNITANGFSVQPLLLAAIVLHAENNSREARKVLDRAV